MKTDRTKQQSHSCDSYSRRHFTEHTVIFMYHELSNGFGVDSIPLIYLDRQLFLPSGGKDKKWCLSFYVYIIN